MKKPLLVIGSVAVLVVAGVTVVSIGRFGRWRHGKAAVDVTLKGNGAACAIDANVDDLGGRKKAKLKWHVVNKCDSAQYVTFLAYRERLSNGTYGAPVPVVDRDPVWSKSLDANGGTDTVEVTIDRDNPNLIFDKEFKYFVCFGVTPNPVPDPIGKPSPNCLDPDADVWP